jgi:hypothetical protein
MALCTVSGVKAYYGLTDSTTDIDNLLQSLVDSVSAQFETYCGRTFALSDYVEYYDGSGKNRLSLDQYPITTISGIWDDVNWLWTASTLISGTYYRTVNNSSLVFSDSATLTKGEQNIKVAYSAGYATIPYDLEQACIEEVLVKYKVRKNVEIRSKTLPDGTVVYGGTDAKEPFRGSTTEVLNKYRKRTIL